MGNTMRSLALLVGLCICLAKCKGDSDNVSMGQERGIAPKIASCKPGYTWVYSARRCMSKDQMDHMFRDREDRGVVPGAYKRICYPGYIWVEWRKKCMRTSRGVVPGAYKEKCRAGFIWVEWKKKCMRTSKGVVPGAYKDKCRAGFHLG